MAVAKKSRKAKATDRLRPWRRRSPMRKLGGGKVVLKCEAVPEKEIEGERNYVVMREGSSEASWRRSSR